MAGQSKRIDIMPNAFPLVPPLPPYQTVPPLRTLPSLIEDTRAGLLTTPRRLPPKYFYDEIGSQLFDRICTTPEYYPTRTEAKLLATYAERIIALTSPRHIFELGSGTSRKTWHLFDALGTRQARMTYWPFDVCAQIVQQAAGELAERYPHLQVNGLVGDYHAGLGGLPAPEGARLFVFLGGTIGNFTHDEAVDFLRELRHLMRPGDWLLLGADRVKEAKVLEAAYNDQDGMTAAFNLNLLNVLNRELGADFEPAAFRHRAIYNPEAARIEMYLIADTPQRVHLAQLETDLVLTAGERILTEISRKFTLAALTALLAEAGLTMSEHFAPDNDYYSLILGQPAVP